MLLTIFNLLIIVAIILTTVRRLQLNKKLNTTLQNFAQMHGLNLEPPNLIFNQSGKITGSLNGYPILIERRQIPGTGRTGKYYLYFAFIAEEGFPAPLYLVSRRPKPGSFSEKYVKFMSSPFDQTEHWIIQSTKDSTGTMKPIPAGLSQALDTFTTTEDVRITIYEKAIEFEQHYHMPDHNQLEQIANFMLSIAKVLAIK